MVFFSKKKNLYVQKVFLKQKIQAMISQAEGMAIKTYKDIKYIYIYISLPYFEKLAFTINELF